MMTVTLVVLLFGACFAMPTLNGTTEMTTEGATIEIETVTATQALDVTTEEFIDCTGYRSHADPNMYQVLFQEDYLDLSCYGSLIWNQDRCRCVNPPSDNEDPNCPNNRPVNTDATKYEERVWGEWKEVARQCPVHQIWNQTGCRCDWDPLGPGAVVDVPVLGGPCEALFNATFDKVINGVGKNRFYVGRSPWNAISIDETVEGAIGGAAVKVKQGAMPLWFSAGNEFGHTFQIQFRFKVQDNGEGHFDDVALLTTLCGQDQMSLSISYRAVDQRYEVFARDQDLNVTQESCIAPALSPFDFHDLSLEYQEDRLVLKVDGSECFSTIFTAGLIKTDCPIILGGKTEGSQQYFDGYFDEVVFRRGCIEEA